MKKRKRKSGEDLLQNVKKTISEDLVCVLSNFQVNKSSQGFFSPDLTVLERLRWQIDQCSETAGNSNLYLETETLGIL